MSISTRLERFYIAFRSPRFFLWFLCAFCAGWMTLDELPSVPRFDGDGFPLLTLILSIEASIASAVLLAVQERQEQKDAKRLKYMLHMIEAVHITGRAILARTADEKVCGNECLVEADADPAARSGVATVDRMQGNDDAD